MINLLVATPEGTLDALMTDSDRQRLESMVNVIWRTDLSKASSENDYAQALADANAEIVMTGWSSPRLTPAIMDKNPQLKYLVNLTGELKYYLERGCLERGLIATNWGDVPAASVAEAALMMTLMSLRRAYYWQLEMHQKKTWRENLAAPWITEGLFDKTVGLYGFGLIARAFAPMLKPFNVRILVYSSWIDDADRDTYGIEPVGSLKELFAKSDIVSVHTGRRPDTFHSVNAEILSEMKDGGHVINTARGPIIDTEALVAELTSGRLFAALDVYEEEPLPADSPLRGLTNCLLFPHQGGPTPDYRFRCGTNAVDQVKRYLDGDELSYIIALKQYDRMT